MKNKANMLAHSNYLLKEARDLIQIKEYSMINQINYCDALRRANRRLIQENYKLRCKRRELENKLESYEEIQIN